MSVSTEQLIQTIVGHLELASVEREKAGLPALESLKIQILGQFALLVNPQAAEQLPLALTADVDALIEGDWYGKIIVKTAIRDLGLVYDELSKEIWIPPGAKFENIYNSKLLTVEALSPLHVLISKAIKAPAKNRFLIQAAIVIYGEELIEGIRSHGGTLDYFLE